MDFIERFLHVSPDQGDGSLELLYVALPLAAFLVGALALVCFGRYPKRKESLKSSLKQHPPPPLSPDVLGIPHLKVGNLHVDETNIPFEFDIDLMRRLESEADKRGITASDLLKKAVERALENPAILSEIESKYVRARRRK